MKTLKMLLGPILALLALSACQQNSPESRADTSAEKPGTDILLTFVEFEKGVDPYRTRVVVTPEFMRFDDGEGSVDFVLFDRRKRIIYSVNSEDETVLAVHPKQIKLEPPMKLALEAHALGNMADAPAIDGKIPQHYQFLANGEICYDTVSVKGLLPDAVDALRDFTAVLASDSKVTFNTIPADLHDPCDMSMSTFAAGRHFAYGFPIQEWSPKGSGRTLIDFRTDYRADPALFVLPKAYTHFTVQEFREGKVMPDAGETPLPEKSKT